MEYRLFGKTNRKNYRIIFGAAALAEVTQKEADETMELVCGSKINHIDTAASYGDSEILLGPWIKTHRKDFFISSKTEKRNKKGAKEELYRTLDRLQTDSIDLWQMHVLIKEEEWKTAMGPDGALEAFQEARDEGLVNYLGVTGHDLQAPEMHLRSLETFKFDSVLLPWNYTFYQNEQYRLKFNELISLCRQKNIAVQTIKSCARRLWGNQKKNFATWYEPLQSQENIDRAVAWILHQDDFFLNSTGDIHLLPKLIKAADHYFQGRYPDITDQAMNQWVSENKIECIFPNPDDQ